MLPLLFNRRSSVSQMLIDNNCKLLNWNVRGLNSSARCQVVKELVAANNCSIVCLQETKLQAISAATVQNILGRKFTDLFAVLQASGTRGGILLAASQEHYSLSQIQVRRFTVIVNVKRRVDNEEWTLTGVYGPQLDSDKNQFVEEIRDIKPTTNERWLLLGDFNLIYRVADKSRGQINRGMLNRFRQIIQDIEVRQIHLHGRRYTWSSGTATPMQTKIDHVFVSKDWELMYPDCHLQACGTSVSDHCPMLLTCSPFHKKYRGFRFESYWLQMPEFKEMVAHSWAQPVSSSNKACTLHIKLARLAKSLKRWHKQKMRDSKKESTEAQQLILRLDQ
jgi:exonuclease III